MLNNPFVDIVVMPPDVNKKELYEPLVQPYYEPDCTPPPDTKKKSTDEEEEDRLFDKSEVEVIVLDALILFADQVLLHIMFQSIAMYTCVTLLDMSYPMVRLQPLVSYMFLNIFCLFGQSTSLVSCLKEHMGSVLAIVGFYHCFPYLSDFIMDRGATTMNILNFMYPVFCMGCVVKNCREYDKCVFLTFCMAVHYVTTPDVHSMIVGMEDIDSIYVQMYVFLIFTVTASFVEHGIEFRILRSFCLALATIVFFMENTYECYG